MTCPQSRPARALAASAFLGLLPTLAAQNKPAEPAAAAPKQAPAGLPTWLLPVPQGSVMLGVPAEKLLEICRESVNSNQPERADPELVKKMLKNTTSELGRIKKDVPAFLLAKWPVKNGEYLHFIEKTKSRFPYGWWRYGCKDDYEKRIPEINKQFPKMGAQAAVEYWIRHWKDLPYKLVDDQGKSIENQPVAHISWIDAVKFAGWVGMRLPNETEYTRAARGDADIYWPWANNKDLGDKYSEKAKAFVRLASSKDQALKDVGAVEALTGPYGHVDMFGQLWQYTGDLGYGPLSGKAAFETEWKKLTADKLGKQITSPPIWKDNLVVIKGGCYISGTVPVQLHVDVRMGVRLDETLETIGFRLAKSLKPGSDMLASLTKTDYSTALFTTDQKPDLDNQAGIERYELAENGFPNAYHALSFAPVNFLSRERSISIEKLADESLEKPMLIATIATTEKLMDPALEPGIYSLMFRKKGQPKELEDALKLAFKDIQAAAKKKGKADKAGEEAPAEEKKPEWKSVIAKFGLTEKDLEDQDTYEKTKFIRIGEFVIPTTDSLYLFVDNENKYRAFVKRKQVGLVSATSFPPQFSLGKKKGDNGERESVLLHFGAPIQAGIKRAVEFRIEVVFDAPPPPADKAWRLPTHLEAFADEPETASNGGNNKESANGSAAPKTPNKPAEKAPADKGTSDKGSSDKGEKSVKTDKTTKPVGK